MDLAQHGVERQARPRSRVRAVVLDVRERVDLLGHDVRALHERAQLPLDARRDHRRQRLTSVRSVDDGREELLALVEDHADDELDFRARERTRRGGRRAVSRGKLASGSLEVEHTR